MLVGAKLALVTDVGAGVAASSSGLFGLRGEKSGLALRMSRWAVAPLAKQGSGTLAADLGRAASRIAARMPAAESLP